MDERLMKMDVIDLIKQVFIKGYKMGADDMENGIYIDALTLADSLITSDDNVIDFLCKSIDLEKYM